jgi:hypothetical protein
MLPLRAPIFRSASLCIAIVSSLLLSYLILSYLILSYLIFSSLLFSSFNFSSLTSGALFLPPCFNQRPFLGLKTISAFLCASCCPTFTHRVIGVQRGVFKGIKDGRRPLALRAGHSGMTRLQGVKGRAWQAWTKL